MKQVIVIFAVLALSVGLLTSMVSAEPKHVAVIVKATDSDFWQYALIGANNYAVEYADAVRITKHGATSESEVEDQVAILEDVIASGPDAIVLAPINADALSPGTERAMEMGIPVITIDSRLRTEDYTSLLATDNVQGGKLAAENMVAFLNAAGIPLKGKVGIVAAVEGVSTIIERDGGFIEKMKEIAPDIEVLEPRYVQNDILKSLAVAEDLITAHGDELIGIYPDNNHTGDGVARAIIEQGLEEKIVVVAFDSDPEEIEALRSGSIKALVVQDPFKMGYMGVDYALKALAGEEIPKFVDTGVGVVTKENMDQEDIKSFLDPTLKEKK